MKNLVLSFVFLALFSSVLRAVPPILNYAGQVAVDGQPFTGDGQFKFALVDADGNLTHWSNDGTSANGSEPSASVSVSVSGGLYSVLLGNSAINGMNAIDPTIFQQHTDAKLRVWFNDGVNGFQQLTPDRSFASVPYAMSAGSASLGDGSVSMAKMDPTIVRYFMPEISSNPASVSILQGTGTTLSVQANGKFLTYQWQRNGVNLAGETNASLVLSDANASVDDANYSVVISNDWGNVTSQVVSISVATALPTITLNGLASLNHEAATAYSDAGASALDALGNDLNSSILVTGADVNVTSVGPHLVTYSVTDAGGNSNSATRTVTVEDTTNPVLSLMGDSNHTHNLNTAWVDPGYDANDTLDGNLTASVSISGALDVNTTGTYTLNYSVSDTAGNQADINRTVNVLPMGPWTFTNAGATGRLGPTQVQIDVSYSGTTLEGAVTINSTYQGIQEWTVPASGSYRIEAWGAKGGDNNLNGQTGGLGAYLRGDFTLQESQAIKILVGQQGSPNDGSPSGGGGTFLASLNNEALIVAGGGGGVGAQYQTSLLNASISTSGNRGYHETRTGYGQGGADGNGGSAGRLTPGGGGFHTNGSPSSADGASSAAGFGYAFINGGLGGSSVPSDHTCGGNFSQTPGGFGGGGGAGYAAAGSGGGYSGGGGSDGCDPGSGGGGGSFNSGTNQDNQVGVNEGHGKVIITYIGN